MEVPLTRGLVAVIDDEDYELISEYRWHAVPGRLTHYARTNAPHPFGPQKYFPLPMHRLILGLGFGEKRQGDHRNGNGLDNRRSNLRIVTHKQNSMNRSGWGTSRHKGVCLFDGRWQSYIYSEGKRFHLGSFTEEEDAARAYDVAAARIQGEHARLNFP